MSNFVDNFSVNAFFLSKINTLYITEILLLVSSGQGFAFKKKQKVKHEYNKLLRKERKKNPGPKETYKEEYPQHLKHLYLAEAEKIRNESRANRVNRSKLRMKEQLEELDEDDYDKTDFAAGSALTGSVSVNPESTSASERKR